MPERLTPGPVCVNTSCVKEAVCIHTKKIYDSCRDKDCRADLKVSLTRCSQEVLERAITVKPRRVELLWVYVDVEPVPFDKGFYAVDVRYFYKVTAEAYCGAGRPYEISGLATYTKRAILYGSEGSVRIFSSCGTQDKSNMPHAVVEVVDPIVLGMKVVEKCPVCCVCESTEVPESVCSCFDDELIHRCDGKVLLATIGQFSIIRLERDTQLLIPAYDFCIPEKDCAVSSEDPCDLFEKFKFPVDEFFPPETRCVK